MSSKYIKPNENVKENNHVLRISIFIHKPARNCNNKENYMLRLKRLVSIKNVCPVTNKLCVYMQKLCV